MAHSKSTRRKFLRQVGASTFMLTAASLGDLAAQENHERRVLEAPKRVSANDKVRIALIGAGIQGHNERDSRPGSMLYVGGCRGNYNRQWFSLVEPLNMACRLTFSNFLFFK